MEPFPCNSTRRLFPPPSHTKWTRLVHPSVLIGHVSSDEIGLFEKLRWLDVVGCMLVSPPPVIVQRGCRPIVSYLRKLLDSRFTRSLDLDGADLLHVPLDLLEQTQLTRLQLARNGLTILPDALGAPPPFPLVLSGHAASLTPY